MSLLRVLGWMGLCRHTGLSTPECSCRQCCRALIWRYAPALLDQGPLEQPCAASGRGFESVEIYANPQGISEHELWLISSMVEAQA